MQINLNADAKPESCRQPPGVFVPRVNRSRCEGKAACVAVCPVEVFELDQLSAGDKADLPPVARLRAWVHGNRQAFAVHAERCEACGLCVRDCPEQAIVLQRVAADSG